MDPHLSRPQTTGLIIMLYRNIYRRIIFIVCLCAWLLGCAGPDLHKAGPPKIPVTILFFNDLHGYLRPFEIKTDKGHQMVGGIARLATLIESIRKDNDRNQIKTIVLVAGDILQGTAMSTIFKGEPDVKSFNAVGVDALTVGNHEFDFGLENFNKLKAQAAFPFLSANILEKHSGSRLCPASITITLAGDLSITIIGVTTRHLLDTTKAENVAALDVMDPLASVLPVYNQSRRRGPVVLLSHCRHKTDRAIARAIPELAAIIGGHDQILMAPHRRVGPVPIFQAFEKGRYLGRIDLEIDAATQEADVVSHAYIPVTKDIAPHPQVAGIVSDYGRKLEGRFTAVIGHSTTMLNGERDCVRYEETTLGNFIADIMVARTGAQAALINSGGLRASINPGPVTVEDVFKAIPYNNELVLVKLSGSDIVQVLNRSVRGRREDEDGGFLQVSNLFFEIQGRRAQNIRIGKNRDPIRPEQVYTVVIPAFLASGGDDHTVFVDKPRTRTRLLLRDLVVDTVKARGVIAAEVKSRIKRMK
jgi:5'-nucleotidase / UDP-sugar diphosphatase